MSMEAGTKKPFNQKLHLVQFKNIDNQHSVLKQTIQDNIEKLNSKIGA